MGKWSDEQRKKHRATWRAKKRKEQKEKRAVGFDRLEAAASAPAFKRKPSVSRRVQEAARLGVQPEQVTLFPDGSRRRKRSNIQPLAAAPVIHPTPEVLAYKIIDAVKDTTWATAQAWRKDKDLRDALRRAAADLHDIVE